MDEKLPITENQDDLEKINLLIIGDQAVGKTSLLIRFTEDQFNNNMIGTAGIDLKRKIVKIEEKNYKVIIYDTAGQERFQKLTKNFYQGSKGIILVYNVTEKKSFQNLQNWMDTISQNADNGVEILILGNKIDLERNVSTEEGQKISSDYNTNFMETSAKTGEFVHEAFLLLLNNIVKKLVRVPTEKGIIDSTVKLPSKEKNKKAKCCQN